MIVTADAYGDYNATSQILRYSALAREVTVPRLPSTNESILQANTDPAHHLGPRSYVSASPIMSTSHYFSRPPLSHSGTYRSLNTRRSISPASPTFSEDRATMEHAALEISRLSEEIRQLQESLSYEKEARLAAEESLMTIDQKMLELEQAIREDCVAEFEQRFAVELTRWKTAMQMALERGEEHWDRKMEVFERSLAAQPPAAEMNGAHGTSTSEDKENVLVESLEEENSRLRRELIILKRELAGRSPTRRAPLGPREDFLESTNVTPRSGRSRHVSQNVHDDNIRGELLHRRLESLTLRADGAHQRSLKKGSGSESSSRVTSTSHAGASGSLWKRAQRLGARMRENDLMDDDDLF